MRLPKWQARGGHHCAIIARSCRNRENPRNFPELSDKSLARLSAR